MIKQLKKVIKQLKKKKSKGVDGLSQEQLIIGSSTLISPLVTIINQPITSGMSAQTNAKHWLHINTYIHTIPQGVKSKLILKPGTPVLPNGISARQRYLYKMLFTWVRTMRVHCKKWTKNVEKN